MSKTEIIWECRYCPFTTTVEAELHPHVLSCVAHPMRQTEQNIITRTDALIRALEKARDNIKPNGFRSYRDVQQDIEAAIEAELKLRVHDAAKARKA